MKKYKISETVNLNSYREPIDIEAKDLTSAKRKASKMQIFQRSVMKVSDASGALICYKEGGKKWVNFLISGETLKDHINRKYGSNKDYARETGKTEPQVSIYIKKRYWVIDGELYGPIKQR